MVKTEICVSVITYKNIETRSKDYVKTSVEIPLMSHQNNKIRKSIFLLNYYPKDIVGGKTNINILESTEFVIDITLINNFDF